MSVIDILFRVDAICKKYNKYNVDKRSELNLVGGDAFACFYASFDSQTEALLHKSEMVAIEKNRVSMVAMNAEIRRTKAQLMNEFPKLQKLARRKVKGLSSEELEMRNDLVLALPERIQAIPDGATTAVKQTGGWATSASHKNIKFYSGR